MSCFWGWDPVDSDTETPLSAWFPPADEQGHVQTPDTCLSRPPAALHRDAPPPRQGEGDKNRPGWGDTVHLTFEAWGAFDWTTGLRRLLVDVHAPP